MLGVVSRSSSRQWTVRAKRGRIGLCTGHGPILFKIARVKVNAPKVAVNHVVTCRCLLLRNGGWQWPALLHRLHPNRETWHRFVQGAKPRFNFSLQVGLMDPTLGCRNAWAKNQWVILRWVNGFIKYGMGCPSRGHVSPWIWLGRTPKGAYSTRGRSRHLLETAFSEPLLRTLLRTHFYCKTHRRPPSQNPSENPFPRTLPRTFSEPFSERCVAVRPLRRAPYWFFVGSQRMGSPMWGWGSPILRGFANVEDTLSDKALVARIA